MTDAKREALKPCPFCGESRFARVEQYMFPPDDGGPAWRWGLHVVCDASGLSTDPRGCGCSSSWGETETDAVAAWNRRALSTLGAAAAVAERDQFERFAAGWHNAVEAICTIAGASNGLGADEAVEAVRTILDRDRTNLRHRREETGKLRARAEARLSEESGR